QNVGDRIAAVHRNDARARLIVRRMQRKRQMNPEIHAGQFVDSRNNADGGDGHVSPPQAAQYRIGHQPDGADNSVQILDTLAHAHKYDGPEPPPRGSGFAPQVYKLFDNLAAFQIAFQTPFRAGAKITAHRAADLR